MNKTPRISITRELLDTIKAEQKRTDVGIQRLFRGTAEFRPDGLTSSSIVHNWIRGKTKTARQDHVEWVLAAYKSYGTAEMKAKSSRIVITDELRRQLIGESERTKLGAVCILRHALNKLPQGLNAQKVQSWMTGNARSAKKDHWEFVLQLYALVGKQP